jgi:Flp pilus assembly protein TadG
MKRFTHKKMTAQGLVEFALILPILLMLFMGVIDFGWILFNYSQLYNGMREALRYGSVPGYGTTEQYYDCAGIRQMLMDRANMSGVKATDIIIVYDDGTPITIADNGGTFSSSNGAPLNTTNDLRSTAEVGICTKPTGSPASTFVANTSYYKTYGSTTLANQTTLITGNRINIDVTVTIHFVSPFIGALSQGVTVHLQGARTVYPKGLQAHSLVQMLD